MRTRAYRTSDLSGLVQLFHETVHAVGTPHYTREELEAWAPNDLRPEDWARRL
jgi:putative acetyltransferase